MVSIIGNHDGSSAVDYTVNPATGFPWATGPRNLAVPFNHLLPAWDAITGTLAAGRRARRRAPPRADRRGPAGPGRALGRRLRDGRQPRQDRRGAGAAAASGTKDGNYLYGAFGRDFLTSDGPPDHDRRADRAPVAEPGRGDRAAARRSRRSSKLMDVDLDRGGRPVRGPRGDRGDPEAVDDQPHARGDRARSSTRHGVCWGPLPDLHASWSTRTPAARPTTRCSRRSSSRGSAPI